MTKRRKGDAYDTPVDVVHKLLNCGELSSTRCVVDPCCGIGNVFAACGDASFARLMYGVEIDPGRASMASGVRGAVVTCGDGLSHCFDRWLDDEATIITNPPYCLAEEFASLYVQSFDEVAMLLPLTFMSSVGRSAFWDRNPGCNVYVLSKRPSFTGDGRTMSTDYGWFCWAKGREVGQWRRI